MAIALSPSVTITERDLTNVVPAVATSIAGAVIDAGWGPVGQVTTIDSENVLVQRFGKPNSSNAANWFSAANFLAYGNSLLVVRTNTTAQRNAVSGAAGALNMVPVTSGGLGYNSGVAGTLACIVTDSGGGASAAATANVGALGVITSITVTAGGSGYTSATVVTIATGTSTVPAVFGTPQIGTKINNETDYLAAYAAGAGAGDVGEFVAKYPGTLGNGLKVSICDSTGFDAWAYKDQFDSAPDTSTYAAARLTTADDELHVIVIDEDGAWTGLAGSVLEKFPFVSKGADARKEDGSTAYYKNVVNAGSKYVWWTNHPTAITVDAAKRAFGSDVGNTAFKSMTGAVTVSLAGGVDDFASTDGQKELAFDLFSNAEELDVNLLICGKASASVANYVTQNIAEVRKDCVAFISPQDVTTGAVLTGTTSDVTTAILAYRALVTSSSYAVVDTGFKYQYDKYNDAYRWVPLNGDIAGLCARTDTTNDPWFSPAGFDRGQIKNVVKLAFSPRQADRDNLYKAGVNPVVSFPGQGTILFGDKTALSKPSAFDRINVRRLFIVLEKAVATASKYQLFNFNDSFTRAQFVGMVSPFLRDVQGRRGITDFKVVCDETNNTGEVIDTNRFVGDIYIKPARSINFIQLNFIATRTGVAFSEIAGA